VRLYDASTGIIFRFDGEVFRERAAPRRASGIEAASLHKSEFLANISH
jgi:hypothetical protein